METKQDRIQKQIIDLELISAGYDQLISQVLEDKEWRKKLTFIEDLESTVRKRQEEIMDNLNALFAESERKDTERKLIKIGNIEIAGV